MQIHLQFCHLSLAGYEIFRNFCCEKFPVFLHFTYALLSFGGVRWVSRPIGINYYYGLVFVSPYGFLQLLFLMPSEPVAMRSTS